MIKGIYRNKNRRTLQSLYDVVKQLKAYQTQRNPTYAAAWGEMLSQIHMQIKKQGNG